MTVTAPDSRETTLLLTVEEAARQLRIGRTRMYHLVTTGAVGSVFIGRLRRIPLECLDRYVKSLMTGPQEATTEGES
jgi:excisionase family DNA binding protein